MATTREIRRLAFQTLYQLDARGAEPGTPNAQEVMDSLEGAEDYSSGDRRKAFAWAEAAYHERRAADAEFEGLAPTWPAHRQAAVDRAILRLAHHEIRSGKSPPKVAVNEAVELAKTFGGEKSPSFVNALLDKVLKRVLADAAEG